MVASVFGRIDLSVSCVLDRRTNDMHQLFNLLPVGAMIAMTSSTSAQQIPDAATDPRIDHQVQDFLADLNKDSSPFWTLPGPQVRATLTGLQNKYPVDISGVTITDQVITEDNKKVKVYIMKPEQAKGPLPILFFVHGGVWIAGDFENHKRFVRDLVLGSGAIAVFPEYTPIPDAVYPTRSLGIRQGARDSIGHLAL
jgi:acetyl esterase